MKLVSPEFSELIESLFEQLTLDKCVEPEEFRLAKEFEALPLGYDLTAFVFLKPGGEMIWWDFIVNEVGKTKDKQSLIRAIVKAAKRYPQLEKFIPERPVDAEVCIACNGTKLWGNAITTNQPARCVFCAGLGWTVAKEQEQ